MNIPIIETADKHVVETKNNLVVLVNSVYCVAAVYDDYCFKRYRCQLLLTLGGKTGSVNSAE